MEKSNNHDTINYPQNLTRRNTQEINTFSIPSPSQLLPIPYCSRSWVGDGMEKALRGNGLDMRKNDVVHQGKPMLSNERNQCCVTLKIK